mmetsp:Transcript_30653/g.85864  ORF Transcript_30653/g.85864 Transcript_30653/m.85864 type:complete len:220 (+) Transcript_30653:510-1169(+)
MTSSTWCSVHASLSTRSRAVGSLAVSGVVVFASRVVSSGGRTTGTTVFAADPDAKLSSGKAGRESTEAGRGPPTESERPSPGKTGRSLRCQILMHRCSRDTDMRIPRRVGHQASWRTDLPPALKLRTGSRSWRVSHTLTLLSSPHVANVWLKKGSKQMPTTQRLCAAKLRLSTLPSRTSKIRAYLVEVPVMRHDGFPGIHAKDRFDSVVGSSTSALFTV